MAGNYWQTILKERISRRRALAAAGAGSAAAALLAACGGSDGGPALDSNGLIAPYVDSSDRAKPGGIWQSQMTRSSLTFDPLTGTQADLAHSSHVYQRLLRVKVGTVFDPPDGSVEGDAASSYEVSPDGLRVTLKLRPNNKLDPRPPTNGRPVTVDDVRYSFEKFSQFSPNRANVLNSVSPDLPVESVTTPDSSTVQVKLAFPDSSILLMLAWGWFLNVVPVEAEDRFDPRQEMRGSGPWMLTEYQASASWSYRRNPNYFDLSSGRPYLEGIDYALIGEPAVSMAQFKAQRLWNYTPPADQVITLKREHPDALMYQQSPREGNQGYRLLSPSKLPNTPLNDVRVRRAASLLIDRDLMIEVFGNVEAFAREGIEVDTAWHSHAPASWPTIWLDPKQNKLGEDSKWFHHNPDEAAKLLRAAGVFGLEQDFAFFTPAPGDWPRMVEVVRGMLEEGGHFKLNFKVTDYNAHYQPTYNRSNNQFEGFAAWQVFSGLPDWNMVMWNHTNPGARNSYISDFNEVPGLREVMIKSRQELDVDKRVQLAHEWQKLMAKHMPFIPYSMPGGAATFSFAWPWFGNYGVFKTHGTATEASDVYTRYWYDKSKDPRSA